MPAQSDGKNLDVVVRMVCDRDGERNSGVVDFPS